MENLTNMTNKHPQRDPASAPPADAHEGQHEMTPWSKIKESSGIINKELRNMRGIAYEAGLNMFRPSIQKASDQFKDNPLRGLTAAAVVGALFKRLFRR